MRRLNIQRIYEYIEQCGCKLDNSPTTITDKLFVVCSCGYPFDISVKQLYKLQNKETIISCGCLYKKWTNQKIDIAINDRNFTRLTNCNIQNFQPSSEHVLWKCTKCNYEWRATVDNVINKKSGCPKCAGNLPYNMESLTTKLKSKGRFDLRLIKINDSKYSYDNKYKKGLFECVKCSHIWTANIHNVIKFNYGCPICNSNIGTPVNFNNEWFHSKLEYYFYQTYISKNINLKFERQKRYSDRRRLTCDFYFPQIHAWVEISGKYLLQQSSYIKTIEEKKKLIHLKNEQLIILSSIPEINNFISTLTRDSDAY